MSDPHEITELLRKARAGDEQAIDALMPKVYDRLRKVAERCLGRGSQAQTISPTVLVHEIYIDLIELQTVTWKDRAHFFAYAATTMRTFLVDYARTRATAKRGGGASAIDWTAVDIPVECLSNEMLALDQALTQLEKLDPSLARIVELRFFGGLSGDEVAEVMGIAPRTVDRGWQKARALLHTTLR